MTNYYTYNDKELFTLIKGGDTDAFSEIYNRYWSVLYRHARKMTKDDDLAKDVVQDVFVTLWDKVEEMHFNTSVSAYFYTTVRNKILNLYEREKVKTNYIASLESFIEKGENITDHLLRERLLAAKIEEEIALLPNKMRHIFEMSRKENMSYKEIAENLDLSDKTVKKQVSNAIKILRLKLGTSLIIVIATTFLKEYFCY